MAADLAVSQPQSSKEPVITPWALIRAGPVLPGAGCSLQPQQQSSPWCAVLQAQPPVPPEHHSVPLQTGRDLLNHLRFGFEL